MFEFLLLIYGWQNFLFFRVQKLWSFGSFRFGLIFWGEGGMGGWMGSEIEGKGFFFLSLSFLFLFLEGRIKGDGEDGDLGGENKREKRGGKGGEREGRG